AHPRPREFLQRPADWPASTATKPVFSQPGFQVCARALFQSPNRKFCAREILAPCAEPAHKFFRRRAERRRKLSAVLQVMSSANRRSRRKKPASLHGGASQNLRAAQ